MSKLMFCLLLSTFVVIVTGHHLFVGTNVGRDLMYHFEAKYHARPFKRRFQNLNFRIPPTPENNNKAIQGIMAYDLTNSTATAALSLGGVGLTYMTLQMMSERGRELHYDVHVYV